MSISAPKYLDLIHAFLDGQASEKQLSALEEYVAAHPEAQRDYAEWKKLTEILNRVEEVEVPNDLHRDIMAALPRWRPAAEVGHWARPSLFRIPLVRYAYAMAAGLVLGIVLTGIALKNLSPTEKSSLYGTITSRPNAPDYAVAEQRKLAGPGVLGAIEVKRSANREVVLFDLRSDKAVDVELKFDSSRAGFQDFSQDSTNFRSVEAKPGTITFQSEGQQKSTVGLAVEGQAQLTLNVSFYVEGALVQQVIVSREPSPQSQLK